MDQFSGLSYTEINNIADQLGQKASSMQDLLEHSIRPQMQKIGTKDDVWSGEAAEQAKAEFDALSEKFEFFYEAITDCSTYLKNTVARYQAVDKAVSGIK